MMTFYEAVQTTGATGILRKRQGTSTSPADDAVTRNGVGSQIGMIACEFFGIEIFCPQFGKVIVKLFAGFALLSIKIPCIDPINPFCSSNVKSVTIAAPLEPDAVKSKTSGMARGPIPPGSICGSVGAPGQSPTEFAQERRALLDGVDISGPF